MWPTRAPSLGTRALVTSALFLSACCAAPVPRTNAILGPSPAGFFTGMCHGVLMLVDGWRRALGDGVAVYDVVNTGWGYNAGFILGSMLFGGFFLALFRAGIGWILAADMRSENVKAVAGSVLNAVVIGLAFLLADWSRLVPRPVALDLAHAPACGVGLGFWHRISALASLPASLVFDDTTIYQVGCPAGYDVGYILPQTIFVALAVLAFAVGLKSALR